MADISLNAETLLSSGIGAFIGSVLTLAGVYLAHRLEAREAARKDAEHLMGLLQGIHDEIETVWEVYNTNVGSKLETLQSNEPLWLIWPINQDYFTIYNANAIFIGKIKDHDLRKKIVMTYVKIRGILDSFHLNNELLQKCDNARKLNMANPAPLNFGQIIPPLTIYQFEFNNSIQALSSYSADLKKQHLELKVLIAELLRHLRKEGVLSSNSIAKT